MINQLTKITPSIHPNWLKLIFVMIPGCALLFYMLPHLVVVTSKSITPRILWRTYTQGQKGYYVLFDFTHPLIKEKVRLTKKFACGPGDDLRIQDNQFYCNDTYLGIAKTYSDSGNELPIFHVQGSIPDGKAFVLGSHPDSFDSRYFGFINIHETEKLITIF